jgi:hypothetical protein
MWLACYGDFVGSRRRQSDIFAKPATLKLRCYQRRYLWELSLIVASLGHHTQFTFQKHPHLGPQMTTFGIV